MGKFSLDLFRFMKPGKKEIRPDLCNLYKTKSKKVDKILHFLIFVLLVKTKDR
jgi:hypothetical protein